MFCFVFFNLKFISNQTFLVKSYLLWTRWARGVNIVYPLLLGAWWPIFLTARVRLLALPAAAVSTRHPSVRNASREARGPEAGALAWWRRVFQKANRAHLSHRAAPRGLQVCGGGTCRTRRRRTERKGSDVLSGSGRSANPGVRRCGPHTLQGARSRSRGNSGDARRGCQGVLGGPAPAALGPQPLLPGSSARSLPRTHVMQTPVLVDASLSPAGSGQVLEKGRCRQGCTRAGALRPDRAGNCACAGSPPAASRKGEDPGTALVLNPGARVQGQQRERTLPLHSLENGCSSCQLGAVWNSSQEIIAASFSSLTLKIQISNGGIQALCYICGWMVGPSVIPLPCRCFTSNGHENKFWSKNHIGKTICMLLRKCPGS